MTAKEIYRNLADTAFSIDRLFVWAISIIGLIGMIGMLVIGYQGRTIPPQIQSATMVCIGALIGRIEKGATKQ